MPVSKIRTKIRQEFERHRYVNKLSVVDMLLTQCHMEFQVRELALKDMEIAIKRGMLCALRMLTTV